MDLFCMVAMVPDDICATTHSISLIGEFEPSALRIGIGTDPLGLVCFELRTSQHTVRYENCRAAVVRASTRINPIYNSGYSYPQMRSTSPSCKWTVWVNVFLAS